MKERRTAQFGSPISTVHEVTRFRDELLTWCSGHIQRANPEVCKFIDVKGLVKSASCILWQAEIWNMASLGCETFMNTPVDPSVVDPICQLWILNRDLILTAETIKGLSQPPYDIGERDNLSAMLVFLDNEEERIMILPFLTYRFDTQEKIEKAESQPDLFIPKVVPLIIRYNQPLRNTTECNTYALLQFLQLEIADVRRHLASRPERRRAVREKRELPDIRFLHLRKTATVTESETGRTFKQSVHYLVRPHWRLQYYPSTEERKPKFITGHVRGNLSGPFKEPTESIYYVVR